MQVYHKFPDVETATYELSKLGYSLIDAGFEDDKIYHVVLKSLPGNYPCISDGRTPRFVAVVLSDGELTFDKPWDNNPVIIRYQNNLRRRFDFTVFSGDRIA